jgi:hypothetical protein
MPKKSYKITEEELDALSMVGFVLEEEARNLNENAGDVPATDLSTTTINHHATVAQMIAGIAVWITKLVTSIRR